ncbi:PAS modulated sigma54 specific transcriptional regulator, Fis family [Desulfobulbus propionicus DSM 2032]|uniref:PAS modulated sigma54 specific transcriptional regulator, Fis family n=1 Tax=Desulfobulbus propionicus (strain ATCC 33891 / DSM 2032 / VKM B-1956 / 1pr3) TaxID=577650 RepID=A0A7U3YMZ5_DESPD|nr:sigma 54-interacting transcriptional regulator [Desulfobulbus propionicus]ADW18350.1 PAS modulated sigma54 specific transcriptional regulator, Fis family [Desulfobulbus propionicus DSM 2032]
MNKNLSREHPVFQNTLAVFSLDRDCRIIGLNKNAELLTGRPLGELFGKSMDELLLFKGQTVNLAELFSQADWEQSLSRQSLLLQTDQEIRPIDVLATVTPLWDRHRALCGALVTLDSTNESLYHQLLLDSVSEGVLTVNRDMEIISFNRAAEAITGWKTEEILGKNCQDVFPEELCENGCLIRSSIEREQSFAAQTVFMTHKDGRFFPLSLTSSPLYDLNGKVIGGVQTFHDCSDSLNNALILASVADGVFTIDRNRTITSFNRAAESITGWKQEEVIGKPCNEIFHSSVCGSDCMLMKAIDRNNMYIDRSIFIKGKAGNSIPVTISSAPLFDDFGNIIGGIETFRDNTSSIRESLILDSIADGVFTVDRNWNITSFNRAAEEITGWSREDAMGMSCSDIFHSSICGKNCAIAESLYSGKPVANRSITIRNSQGEKVPISISAAPLTDHEGNIIGGVETFRDLTAITSLRQQLSQKYTFDAIISKSAAMQRLFNILPEIARSPSTVLILGESGTGKELVARALYNASERKDKPFVVVNCAALPETLLESELFGYKAGAFTDARKDKIGRFAAAEGGTLFLDEIGDIPGAVQVKLLRVLQEKVYEPLGSNTPVKADVRIITATNRNLQALVKEGAFRDDLFYRLNVVKINLPPLRERKEDIPLLIDHFIKKYSAQQGKDIVGISSGALAILMRYDYPGNIRELENIVEYSFILCEGGYIQPQHLPEPFAAGFEQPASRAVQDDGPQTLEEIEKQAIILSLERNRWRKMATCRELAISKDTLRRKIERYGIHNPLTGEAEQEE